MNKAVRLIAIGFALFLAVSIIGGMLSLLFAIPAILTPDSGKEAVYTFEGTEIDKLDIELSAADFIITRGGRATVSVSSDRIKVKEKDGTLTVADTKGFISIRTKAYRVELTLPENMSVKEADIETGAGKLSIEDLTVDKLFLELGAGEVDINGLTVSDKAEISGGAGKIGIYASELRNLDFDAGVGEIDIEAALTGECDIDTGVGELNLKLKGSEQDYKINADTGLGEFKVDGEKLRDGQTYGNGDNVIDIDGGVGEITVEFN